MKYEVHIPVMDIVAINVEAADERAAIDAAMAEFHRREAALPRWLGLTTDASGINVYETKPMTYEQFLASGRISIDPGRDLGIDFGDEPASARIYEGGLYIELHGDDESPDNYHWTLCIGTAYWQHAGLEPSEEQTRALYQYYLDEVA